MPFTVLCKESEILAKAAASEFHLCLRRMHLGAVLSRSATILAALRAQHTVILLILENALEA